jgi:hypothetical protein
MDPYLGPGQSDLSEFPNLWILNLRCDRDSLVVVKPRLLCSPGSPPSAIPVPIPPLDIWSAMPWTALKPNEQNRFTAAVMAGKLATMVNFVNGINIYPYKLQSFASYNEIYSNIVLQRM